MASSQPDYEAAARRIEAMKAEVSAQARPTSLAKTDYPSPESVFANAPNLQESFQDAQTSDEPLEQRPDIKPPHNPISFASTVYPDGFRGTSLEHAPDMKQSFDSAGRMPANQNTPIENGQGQSGSQMVRNDRPHPYPAPNGPERTTVDRSAFDEKWKQEQANASAAQEQIKSAAERIQTMETEHATQPEQSNDMGRGQ